MGKGRMSRLTLSVQLLTFIYVRCDSADLTPMFGEIDKYNTIPWAVHVTANRYGSRDS